MKYHRFYCVDASHTKGCHQFVKLMHYDTVAILH